jgi:hypothetical protein
VTERSTSCISSWITRDGFMGGSTEVSFGIHSALTDAISSTTERFSGLPCRPASSRSCRSMGLASPKTAWSAATSLLRSSLLFLTWTMT